MKVWEASSAPVNGPSSSKHGFQVTLRTHISDSTPPHQGEERRRADAHHGLDVIADGAVAPRNP